MAGQMENKWSVEGSCLLLGGSKGSVWTENLLPGVSRQHDARDTGEVHPPTTISIMQSGQPIGSLGNNVISLRLPFDFSRILRS